MYNSRTELQQARKQWRVPDKSYDFDGDGHVGQRDYFIGKHWDARHEDKLNKSELKRAQKGLNDGWLDRFQFGFDRQPITKPVTTMQKRGVIVTSEDAGSYAETYPPHHNATKAPAHQTKTELGCDRKAEAKNVHVGMKEKWDLKHPVFVKEPKPQNLDGHGQIHHIRERAEADSQVRRVASGLLPYTGPVNPEREYKRIASPGADYVHAPVFRTRSQLLETRKEQHKADCDALRAFGEENIIPFSVRQCQREYSYYEFRRPEPTSMTMSALKAQRKRDRIEYDMAHFREDTKEFPRFSDQPHPFWTLGAEQRPFAQKNPQRSVSEPVLKITDAPSAFAEKIDVGPTMGPTQPLPKAVFAPPLAGPMPPFEDPCYGRQTVKRYTDAMIERGQMRNMPRYFDTLQPIATEAKDFHPIDHYSSFELIKEKSLKDEAEKRKLAENSPTMSRLGHHLPPGASAACSASGVEQEGSYISGMRSRVASGLEDGGGSSSDACNRGEVGGPGERRSRRTSPEKAPPEVTRLPSREAPNFMMGTPSPAKNLGRSGVRCGGFQHWDQTQRPDDQTRADPSADDRRTRGRADSKGAGLSFGAAAKTISAISRKKNGAESGRRSRTHSSNVQAS